MPYNLSPVLKQRFFDANGATLAGGKLYTYQAGTTTPQDTYTDQGGGTAYANPVILDANGEADVWLDISLSYKFELFDSDDVLQWTTDNVIGLSTNNSVSTNSIQDGAVTTAKLADEAVTNSKLSGSASVDADRAVGTDNIKDLAITFAKMAVGNFGKLGTDSKTSGFTAAVGFSYNLDASGGAFAVTLPTAANGSGQIIGFYRTETSLANAVTISDGTYSAKMFTAGEALIVYSNGTTWQTLARDSNSPVNSYTPTFAGFGTATSIEFKWYRRGRFMRILGKFTTGTVSGTQASFTLPSGSTMLTGLHTGLVAVGSSSSANPPALSQCICQGSASAVSFAQMGAGIGSLTQVAGNAIASSTTAHYVDVEIPVTDWEA